MLDAGCTGKTQYLSWDTANRALRRHGRRLRNRGSSGPMTVYRCRHCAFWHTGRSSL